MSSVSSPQSPGAAPSSQTTTALEMPDASALPALEAAPTPPSPEPVVLAHVEALTGTPTPPPACDEGGGDSPVASEPTHTPTPPAAVSHAELAGMDVEETAPPAAAASDDDASADDAASDDDGGDQPGDQPAQRRGSKGDKAVTSSPFKIADRNRALDPVRPSAL